MSRLEDPYGKRALFSPPAGGDDGSSQAASPVHARHATIECSACREVSAVSALGLARRLVPSLWIPGLRWPSYLRCPACKAMTWCSVDWRPVLSGG